MVFTSILILQAWQLIMMALRVTASLEPWDKPYSDWEVLDPKNMPVAPTTLKNVLVVSRHGIYYPQSNQLTADQNDRFSARSPIQLTERGKMMMLRLGRLFIKRYGGFISAVGEGVSKSTKDPTRQYLKLTATDSDAARVSATQIMKGMSLDESAKYKLEEGSQNFDKTFITHKGNSDCPKFSKLRDSFWKPEEILSSKDDPDWELVKDTLKISKVEEVFEMYDRLEMERLSGLPLPVWTEGLSGTQVIQAMRRISIQRMKKITGNSEEGWKFLASSPLTSILEEFGYVKFSEDGKYEVIRQDQKRNIHIHVTEDVTLYSLLWWLKLDDVAACAALFPEDGTTTRNCNDVPNSNQGSNPQGNGQPPQYFAQVGDTLILEFHKEGETKTMKPYFLRLREERGTYKGFWWLTMQRKLQQLSKSHGPNAVFDPILLAKDLISSKKWKEVCSSSTK